MTLVNSEKEITELLNQVAGILGRLNRRPGVVDVLQRLDLAHGEFSNKALRLNQELQSAMETRSRLEDACCRLSDEISAIQIWLRQCHREPHLD